MAGLVGKHEAIVPQELFVAAEASRRCVQQAPCTQNNPHLPVGQNLVICKPLSETGSLDLAPLDIAPGTDYANRHE